MDVLSQLNSPDIIRALNEPDEVKDLLLSVVRIPEADDKMQASKKTGDLENFWDKLIQSETDTLKVLAAFDTQSMIEPSFSANWPDLVDQLADVKYSLRARAVLVDFIHEILSAFYDSEKYIREQAVPKTTPVVVAVSPKANIFSYDIQTLDLHGAIIKGLNKKHVFTIGDLVRLREDELFRIKNFGRGDLERVKAALATKGLRLSMSVYDSE